MDEMGRADEQSTNNNDGDQGETEKTTRVPRTTSVRARIWGGMLTILLLLVAILVFATMLLSRVNEANATADEEVGRFHAALLVHQAAADMLVILAQGAIIQDADDLAQAVEEAKRVLIDAENHLGASAGALPEDDAVYIKLYGLAVRTADVRSTADRMVTAADAGRWWQVENLVQETLPLRRAQIAEVMEDIETLTDERQADARAAADKARNTLGVSTAGLTLLILVVALGTAVITVRSVAVPVERLAEAADRLADGYLDKRVPPERVKEFARLATAFNQMASRLQRSYIQLEEQMAQVEIETIERERAQAESLRLQQEVIEAQDQAIRELSTPVIPVMERIIVMPVVGSVDSMRARDITRALLAGIQEHRAKVVIMDITGVSVVDDAVVNHLSKTIHAARLKGARTIVTGVADAVAETIVDLGIDWSDVDTVRNLRTGLVVALKSLGLELTR